MITNTLFDTQPIIVSLDVDGSLLKQVQCIAEAGFSVIELNCCEKNLFQEILQDYPNLRIGAGNVINTQQLEECHQAGAHFISSPGFLPAIAQTASIYEINYLPGIATFSEAMHLMSLGYHQARPYPATYQFCASLSKCFPILRLYPAEIRWDESEHYLKLPAVAAISILNPNNEHLQALSLNTRLVNTY